MVVDTAIPFDARARRMLIDHEGLVPFMYCDPAGIVTAGVGHALMSVDEAKSLPFVWMKDGTPVRPGSIEAEWNRTKQAKITAFMRHMAAIQLRGDCIGQILEADIARFMRVLRSEMPTGVFDALPDNAKLAALDIAFNCGSLYGWPHFNHALQSHLWATAAAESYRPEVSAERNAFVRKLLEDLCPPCPSH